jgi:hypothetical protein
MRGYLTLFLIFISPAYSSTEDFLGAPLPPEREIIQKTDSRLSFRTDLAHDAVVRFYKEALIKNKDIKFRDKKDSIYIEDHGKSMWHSITISKGDEHGATVTIVRDNWTWIIGTLVLRYIGVFVVLMVICLALSLSGRILPRIIKKMEAKSTGTKKSRPG